MIAEPEHDDIECVDVEDSDDLLGLVKDLVNGEHPGILCTIDRTGTPQARWMSTLDFKHFPVFHSLTAPGSHKVSEIQANPKVQWMFCNQDKSLIVNLSGTARILTEVPTLKQVWQDVVDKSRTYFLDQFSKGLGFVVIETTVDTIDVCSPVNRLRFRVPPSELQRV